ncbi:MazG nucleotide pyrophosphohydrolase domain-containing protein [Methylophaga thalassica]|uniref:MazG nucleotide pyrophosphohydrolase domain-containing protein n=1 Tax=Methylophaga thalassica TaxID=40223 RepID=UPI003608249F
MSNRNAKKASEVGFDWPDPQGVLDKIHEEIDELDQEIKQDSDKSVLLAELGDILFACCNLARHLDINPADALSSSNDKFYRRFNYVETAVTAQGKQFEDFSLEALDALWDSAKQLERSEDLD